MSAVGIASIALFAPVVASNAIFSARRASRGIDALDENPLYAATNFDIAAGQILKGGRAAKGLAVAIDPAFEGSTKGATEAIKEASKATSTSGKILKGAGKVINFTADNINSVICIGSAFKVLGAENKGDEAGRESLRLACMFGAEGATKKIIGMPYTKKVNGKNVSFKREGSYKKLFKKEQLKAMNDFFLVEKSLSKCTNWEKVLKVAPGAAKGLIFVGASIAGYKAGDKLGDLILGEKPSA